MALASDKAAASQTQTETTQTTKGTAKPVKTEPKKTVLGAARVKTTDGFDTSQVVTILFNADSSSFREVTWEKQVRAIAKYLDKHPKQKVEVVGYAAKVKSGSDEDQLSIHRAAAVKNYLVDWGASAKQIVIRGEGYDDPIDDNITDAGRARNRRAVLRFINE